MTSIRKWPLWIVLLAGCLPTRDLAPAATWRQVQQGPTSNDLYGVFGTSPQSYWAVGQGGTVLEWNGIQWSTIGSGTTMDLHAVWGSGPANLYAVGESGQVLGYNGSWAPLSSGTQESLQAVRGGLIAGFNGTLLQVSGSQVQPVLFNGAGPSFSLFSVQTLTGGSIALGSGGDVICSSAGGPWPTAPNAVGSQNIYGVWSPDGSAWWGVGAGGYIGSASGCPSSLQTATVTSNQDLRGIWGASGSDLWAVGDLGTLLHWDGATWEFHSSGTTNDLRAIYGTGPTDIWAVGTSGTLLHYSP